MTRHLDGRIALVTGAARGIGREHALQLAAEGAAVVVNDMDCGPGSPAEATAEEIRAAGGTATTASGDVADPDAAQSLVDAAVTAFGGLDILVNNAGVVRDRMIVTMSESEWDDVVRVHLRGHFLPLRAAARYWRERSQAGEPRRASVVNTTSGSGLFGNPGQANYDAAKAGIAGLTLVAARELIRYGVRVNAISPQARTDMTTAVPAFAELVKPPSDGGFDTWHPGNISPMVTYLSRADCDITGQIFEVQGSRVRRYDVWPVTHEADHHGRWTSDALAEALRAWPRRPADLPGF